MHQSSQEPETLTQPRHETTHASGSTRRSRGAPPGGKASAGGLDELMCSGTREHRTGPRDGAPPRRTNNEARPRWFGAIFGTG